jgi:hypothetical protein
LHSFSRRIFFLLFHSPHAHPHAIQHPPVFSSPTYNPYTKYTTTLFHLLDIHLLAFIIFADVLVADIELALNAIQSRAEDAFEVVRVSGVYEMGNKPQVLGLLRRAGISFHSGAHS